MKTKQYILSLIITTVSFCLSYILRIHYDLLYDESVVINSRSSSVEAIAIMPHSPKSNSNNMYNNTKMSSATVVIKIKPDDRSRLRLRRTPRVAYASSITSCSIDNDTQSSNTVIDTAAVLSYSIRRFIINNETQYTNASSSPDLIMFLHPDAVGCRGHLETLGYQVLVRDTPFQLDEIKTSFFRRRVEEGGCCGRREFLKLWAYTLEEYDVVIHTDLDVLFLKSLDPVIDIMIGNSNHNNIPNHLLGPGGLRRRHLTDDLTTTATAPPASSSQLKRVDFVFTRDYSQASRWHNDPTKYGVQGGFFAVRPNHTIFDIMIDIIKEGRFTQDKGWGQKRYGGYWGSAQIQGFLSYFYGEFQPDHALELDRCRVNTMINDKQYFGNSTTCRTGETTCENCGDVPMEEMISIHLTTCWKPWTVSTC